MVGLIFLPIFLLAIVVPISAIVLRAAIAAANRFLTPDQQESSAPDQEKHRDTPEPTVQRDHSNPFSPPATISENVMVSTYTIAPPSFGRAYVIALVQAVVGVLVSIGFGFLVAAVGIGGQEIRLVSLAISFLVGSAILSGMAPTTYKRAMFVMLFSYLIMLAIALFIGVIIFGFIFAARPD